MGDHSNSGHNSRSRNDYSSRYRSQDDGNDRQRDHSKRPNQPYHNQYDHDPQQYHGRSDFRQDFNQHPRYDANDYNSRPPRQDYPQISDHLHSSENMRGDLHHMPQRGYPGQMAAPGGGGPRRKQSRFDSDGPVHHQQQDGGHDRQMYGHYPQDGIPYPLAGNDRSHTNESRQYHPPYVRDSGRHDMSYDRHSDYGRYKDDRFDDDKSDRRGYKVHSQDARFDDSEKHRDAEPVREMIEDTVFVSSLPLDVTISELADKFGSIGVLKTDKRTGLYRIKIYTTSDGLAKGEASVSYEDPVSVKAAIEWFNGTDLRGNTINVQMAERTFSTSYNSSRGGRGDYRSRQRGGRSGYDREQDGNRFDRRPPHRVSEREGRGDMTSIRGGRGASAKPPFSQPGDWLCQQCQNNNFSWRVACNRCNAPKSDNKDAPSADCARPQAFPHWP